MNKENFRKQISSGVFEANKLFCSISFQRGKNESVTRRQQN